VTTGAVLDEPLARLTGYTLGEHAVNGFLSGSAVIRLPRPSETTSVAATSPGAMRKARATT
jgi:hypothetical protein